VIFFIDPGKDSIIHFFTLVLQIELRARIHTLAYFGSLCRGRILILVVPLRAECGSAQGETHGFHKHVLARRTTGLMYVRNLVKNCLDLRQVPYEHHVHSTAFTAQRLAAVEHVPGAMVAKTVVVKADHRFVMAVLPASARVDLPALRDAHPVPTLCVVIGGYWDRSLPLRRASKEKSEIYAVLPEAPVARV